MNREQQGIDAFGDLDSLGRTSPAVARFVGAVNDGKKAVLATSLLSKSQLILRDKFASAFGLKPEECAVKVSTALCDMAGISWSMAASGGNQGALANGPQTIQLGQKHQAAAQLVFEVLIERQQHLIPYKDQTDGGENFSECDAWMRALVSSIASWIFDGMVQLGTFKIEAASSPNTVQRLTAELMSIAQQMSTSKSEKDQDRENEALLRLTLLGPAVPVIGVAWAVLAAPKAILAQTPWGVGEKDD